MISGARRTTSCGSAIHKSSMHRCAADALQQYRVKKVGAGLEHAHAPALLHQFARQGGGDGGLALAGGYC